MGCGKYPSDWGSISDGHGIELYYVFDEESDAVTLAQSITHSHPNKAPSFRSLRLGDLPFS
jgi:hypothetical protein